MIDPVRYRVTHETRYRYDGPATASRQRAHLIPRQTPWQHLLSHDFSVSPQPCERWIEVDPFGNSVHRFSIEAPHEALLVRARSEVRVGAGAAWDCIAGCDFDWQQARRPQRTALGDIDLEIELCRVGSLNAPVFAEAAKYAGASFGTGRGWLESMLDLNARIHSDFAYDRGSTTVGTPVIDLLKSRRGVCQDFAHLMISALRSIGLPARYVSGYIFSEGTGQSRVGGHASHAWVASHAPGYGWVAFDPTNAKLAQSECITLAWGRDYADVAPLRGVMMGRGDQQLSVSVVVDLLAG